MDPAVRGSMAGPMVRGCADEETGGVQVRRQMQTLMMMIRYGAMGARAVRPKVGLSTPSTMASPQPQRKQLGVGDRSKSVTKLLQFAIQVLVIE